MACYCVATRTSCNVYSGVKFRSFNVMSANVIRHANNRNPVILQRMFLTSGSNDRTVLQIKSILRTNSFKSIEHRFPTKLFAESYLAQNRSFTSTNDRSSDSPPKEISNEMKAEKTKVTIINEDAGSGKMYLPYIYKYSKIGFTIGKNKVIGSVALFPGGILSWKVASHHQITPESLAVFPLIEPKLEILILGVGDKVEQIPKTVWDFARTKKIALEVLDTPNACATYNFLTEEGRRTAAALIPPQTIVT